MARILFLAPQPFYQERGTPIAIDLALKALEQGGHEIDLLTYPEGEVRSYQRVRHFRVPRVPGVHSIRPGFSWKKLIYSSLMAFYALRLAWTRRYTLVHAVEEACFIGLLLKALLRLDYVYDMDSSIARQMVEKKQSLRLFSGLFERMEKLAIGRAIAVVAVCPDLAALARGHGAQRVLLLQDISLLDRFKPGEAITNLRHGMASGALLLLYVGNLERYQGIDLMLEGFAIAINEGRDVFMAVIGGQPQDLARYRRKAAALGLNNRARFFGPRPLTDLGAYLSQADILVSPRSKGDNTPMKIYTYLDAGKALLATRIGSHTQILNDSVACMVDPTPAAMAEGIGRLCADPALRQRIGQAGHQLAEKRHRWPVFRRNLIDFYRSFLTAER